MRIHIHAALLAVVAAGVGLALMERKLNAEVRVEAPISQKDSKSPLRVLGEMPITGKEHTLQVICDHDHGNIVYIIWGANQYMPNAMTAVHTPVVPGIDPCEGNNH